MAAVRILLSVSLCAGFALPIAAQQYPAELLAGLQWRDVGPMRGGRTYPVSGNASQPDTFYMGSVGGGVWKTENSGRTWFSIADDPVTGNPDRLHRRNRRGSFRSQYRLRGHRRA